MSSSDMYSYEVRNGYLQSALAGCLLNGVFVAAVSMTIYASGFKRGWISLLRPMVASTLVMYALATIQLIIYWRRVKLAFINYGQTDQDIIFGILKAGSPLLSGIRAISFYVNMTIADSVLVWRCWIIWKRNWKIVALPILLVIAELTFGVFYTVSLLVHNFSLFVLTETPIGYMNAIASISSTLLTTVLITYRILRIGGPKFKPIIAIVIESAVLYSIALIFYMIFCLQPTSYDINTEVVFSQITGLGPTLIMTRIAFGLAPPDSSWNDPVSVFRFGTRERSRVTEQSVGASDVFSLESRLGQAT